MVRRNKGNEFLDPYKFAEDFCSRRGLVSAEEKCTTELEKLCHLSAEAARHEYKTLRDTKMSEMDETEPDSNSEHSTEGNAAETAAASAGSVVGLNPAEKYQRRLRNNRKSSAATKVYREVLKRELSTVLRRTEFAQPQEFIQASTQFERVKKHRDNLLLQNKGINEKFDLERRKNAALTFDLQLSSKSQRQTMGGMRALKGTSLGGAVEHNL